MKYWPFILAGFAAACGGPTGSDVRTEFLASHPRASIVSVGPGEGDQANVYYHIRYRLPTDTALWEQVWLYQRGRDDRWHVTWRDSSLAKRAT